MDGHTRWRIDKWARSSSEQPTQRHVVYGLLRLLTDIFWTFLHASKWFEEASCCSNDSSTLIPKPTWGAIINLHRRIQVYRWKRYCDWEVLISLYVFWPNAQYLYYKLEVHWQKPLQTMLLWWIEHIAVNSVFNGNAPTIPEHCWRAEINYHINVTVRLAIVCVISSYRYQKSEPFR